MNIYHISQCRKLLNYFASLLFWVVVALMSIITSKENLNLQLTFFKGKCSTFPSLGPTNFYPGTPEVAVAVTLQPHLWRLFSKESSWIL